MKILKNIFLILFFIATENISAREYFFQKDSITPHNFLEVGYGSGMVNNRFTMAATLIEVGYKNAIVTARICRSSGTEFEGYIFEDAFMMGYRFHLGNFFNTTFSGGYSDLAFEKGYHSYFAVTPDKFNKTGGFSLQCELEWKIPFGKHISPFSLSAIYYTTFNKVNNLNGFAFDLKFCFDQYGTHWFD